MSGKFAIVGYPLGHSMSPVIHKKLFELCGKSNFDYEVMEISPDEFDENFNKLKNLDGLNVTIPHKVSIIKHLNKLDKQALTYGSVNVVDCSDKNNILGYNTDVFGFIRSIELLNTSLSNSKVLLLGIGGVGRMMAIETCLQGGNLTVAIRNQDIELYKAVEKEILDKNKNAKISMVSINEINSCFDIMINATPVGMYPNIKDCPVCEKVIKNCKYIFDCVYNPVKTKLISLAKLHNVKVLGGMAMLVYQAVVSHEIWFNAKFNKEDIEKLIVDMEIFVKENFN